MEAPQNVKLVRMLDTKIWVETDFAGARHVVVQHEGTEPFTYATFHYGYGYTDNAGTRLAAEALARNLGAAIPVEFRKRPLPPPMTAAEIRDRIATLQSMLAEATQ